MRYTYDFEFLEDGTTIDPISIGIVCEDGREFYGVSIDADWGRILEHPWLMKNVVNQLPGPDSPEWMTLAQIKSGVLNLIGNDPFVQLWAYFSDYDHVTLMQMWGTMMNRPPVFPMRTRDIAQRAEERGNPVLPDQVTGTHNALEDARWNMQTLKLLDNYSPLLLTNQQLTAIEATMSYVVRNDIVDGLHPDPAGFELLDIMNRARIVRSARPEVK